GVLKMGGFLTRDSRVVERKKYGKAKARRSFQFSKRKDAAANSGRPAVCGPVWVMGAGDHGNAHYIGISSRKVYTMNMQSVTAKPAVAISGLYKTYDTGFTALKDVNLDIRSGEIVALLGPNGAGKTTLIGTVCGLVRPTSGQILVGGHDVVTEF